MDKILASLSGVLTVSDLPPFTQLMLYGLGLFVLGFGMSSVARAFWLFVTLKKATNDERLKYFSRSLRERFFK